MKFQSILILSLILVILSNCVYSQDVEKYMKEANKAREQMDYDKAAQLYSKVIENDPNNIEALYYRGWVENVWNKSKGLDDFKRVLELDSLHEGALSSLAESYAILGKHELAEKYKMKAISINPKSASNLLTLARNANSSKEYEKAVELCNEAIQLNDETQIWLQLLERAEAYYMLGKYDKSIKDFEKCFNEFDLGMYSCNNYEMCGDAYNGLGNSTKACEYWKIAVNNDDPEFDPASDEVKLKVKKNCNK